LRDRSRLGVGIRSIQDDRGACNVPTGDENVQGKTILIRIVSTLTGLGLRSYEMRENPGFWDNLDNDNEKDNDNSAKPFVNGLI
jgi:hypothetical protein